MSVAQMRSPASAERGDRCAPADERPIDPASATGAGGDGLCATLWTRWGRGCAGLLTRQQPFSRRGPAMQGLTQRQQMVLVFIRQSISDRGYPPTLREIGARMGIRSTNGVNDHLRALE